MAIAEGLSLGVISGLFVAATWDLRTREIPDAIPVVLFVGALAAVGIGWWPLSWWALVGGVALGLLLPLPLFLKGGLGGGDVKLLAAAGAWLGPLGLLSGLLWVALAGLVLAVIAAARGKRDLAYGPAIAVGLASQLVWPEAAARLAGL